MIHGCVPHNSLLNTEQGNRRDVDRLVCSAEVVVAWNHDLAQRVRLRMVDISEHGMKVASSMPLIEGMTGIAISLIPDGVDLHRVFTVRWSKQDESSGEYTAGIRFLS